MGKQPGHANYGGHGKIATGHPGWIIAMNKIPRALAEDLLFSGVLDGSGQKMLLTPDQKSLEWMMKFASKFRKAGE